MRSALLALLLVATCATLKFFPYTTHNITTTIPCNNGEITLINHSCISSRLHPSAAKPMEDRQGLDGHTGRAGELIMIDPGFIASRPSYESFISYTLMPEIIQKTGSMHIEHLIVFKFNKRILDALQFLATKITIKNIYLPAWKGKIPPFAWRSYANLKQTVSAHNGKIISVSYKKKLYNDESCTLFIEPTTTKEVQYYDATYQPLRIQCTLDNQTFTL